MGITILYYQVVSLYITRPAGFNDCQTRYNTRYMRIAGAALIQVKLTNLYSSLKITGAGQFKVLPNTGGNSSCLSGTPVAQNGTCTFTVQFTSTSGGISYSETMSISDNGGASPQTVKITAKD